MQINTSLLSTVWRRVTARFSKESASTAGDSEWPQDSDWDEDLEVSEDRQYTTLLRTIRWAKGFGLLFVQCSPAEGERLIKRIQKDVGGKRFNRLDLDKNGTDLYELLKSKPSSYEADVLFLTGLDKSLIEYMKPEQNRTYSEREFYAEDKVPKLLGQLNLQREKLKETFPLCFVFLVPRYTMKYLVRKAPDFFDWRAGVWEFVSPQKEVQQKTQRFLQEGDYQQYLSWSSTQRRQRIFEIDDLASKGNCTDDKIVSLRIEQGNLLLADKRYEEAIASYEESLNHKPDNDAAWNNRGIALRNLERYEEAIASYEESLKHKPDDDAAWYNRGIALAELERYEEAIASYEESLKHKPDDDAAWYNRGIAFDELERYEEAIASYEESLKHKPDDDAAWYNRGMALRNLERYEEAISSYEESLKHKPDDHSAWYNRGNALGKLERHEEAIASYEESLKHKPDDDAAWYNRGNALRNLERYEEAIASYEESLKHKADDDAAWYNRGIAFAELERYEEAIASLNKALEIKPDMEAAHYNKACYYALLGNPEAVLESLQQAITLAPKKYRAMVKTDTDFDSLCQDPRFQALITSRESTTVSKSVTEL